MSDDATTRPRPGLSAALQEATEAGLQVTLRLVYSESHPARPPERFAALSPTGGRTAVIGRNPGEGADDEVPVRIDFDTWASRRHASATLVHLGDSPGVMVVDHGSHNGTFIDGKRVVHRDVARTGQILRIGGSIFTIALESPSRRAEILAKHPPPAGLVVDSWASVTLWERLAAVAQSDDGVLLLGELGTGKSILARHLHDLSARKAGPFVRHNASAIPLNLEEATLFGVAAGFIPGVRQKQGLLETASGGTLFLDELSEMPLAAQVKLLDAFDPRDATYCSVGSTDRRPTRCRLVSATNRDPFALIDSGVVRHDLLSRLVVAQLTVSPLAARRADILPIFWRACGAAKLGLDSLSRAELAEAMLLAPWTENVRGLLGLVKRMTHGEALTLALINDQGSRGERTSPVAPLSATSTQERSAGAWPLKPNQLLDLFSQHDFNVSQAADEVDRRRETVARAAASAFGSGGKPTILRAYAVYRASGRAPTAAELSRAHTLFVESADDPSLGPLREAWQAGGVIPESLD